MNAAAEIKRAGRSLGIVAVFTVLGPIVVASFLLLVVSVVGVPFLQLMLLMVDLEALRPWLSIAMFLLIMFSLVASIPPAFVTGLAFAIASVYFGANSIWVAVAAAALVEIGIVVMGFVVSPSESSPVLLPTVQGMRQALGLSVLLVVPAVLAASLCWLVTRKLHRVPS